jgi:hypothetical protein
MGGIRLRIGLGLGRKPEEIALNDC